VKGNDSGPQASSSLVTRERANGAAGGGVESARIIPRRGGEGICFGRRGRGGEALEQGGQLIHHSLLSLRGGQDLQREIKVTNFYLKIELLHVLLLSHRNLAEILLKLAGKESI